MTTALAPATAAPLSSSHVNPASSPHNYSPLQPSHSSAPSMSTPHRISTTSQDISAAKSSPPERRRVSPATQGASAASKVTVKKEPPASPTVQSKPRPRKLELSVSSDRLSVRGPSGPMTAREGVNMKEVGLACLSPGFQTHDPIMREQLQRSLSVRDQQRSIIEARLNKPGKDDASDGAIAPSDSSLFGPSKPGSLKRRPPPGLSIVPPSASQFANERMIQSAPLHQTYTGRNGPQPLSRHVNQAPSLGSKTYIHHVPATQTNNRLPPLSDVFGSDALGTRDRDRDGGRAGYLHGTHASNSSQSSNLPPLPSPGLPANTSQSQQQTREYRSAEDAVHELSGGREELLPRIVHYPGNQPTTPPSPQHLVNGMHSNDSMSCHEHAQAQPILHSVDGTARRRPRSEYEQDSGSPPLGHGPEPHYRPNPGLAAGSNHTFHGAFGNGRDSPESQRRKKEEFLSLCARAWDLFHS